MFFLRADTLTPQIKGIENISLTESSQSKISATADLLVDNTRGVTVNLLDMRIQILYHSDTLGSAQSNQPINLSTDSIQKVPLLIELRTPKILHLFSQELDTIQLDIEGEAFIKWFIIKLPLPIKTQMSLSPKDVLKRFYTDSLSTKNIAKVNRAYLKSLGFSESIVTVEFSLTNPVNLPITLLSYPATLFINDRNSGTGNIDTAIYLAKMNDTAAGTISFHLNNLRTLIALGGGLLSAKLEYETKGKLHIQVFDNEIILPYSFKGVLKKL
jgi:LEA14-like dessication related protein